MSKLSKTQRTLLLMVIVFAVPYALSWLLYLNPGWFNLGTRNNGTLISPVIEPQQVVLKRADGETYQVDLESGKWTLMMFGGAQCDAACEKTLFTLQQLRKMMGVDKAKLRRVYVMLGESLPAELNDQIEKYAGTIIQTADQKTETFLEQKLELESRQLSQKILIADPYGNLVMWYPQDIDPKKIFADIEILFGRVKNV